MESKNQRGASQVSWKLVKIQEKLMPENLSWLIPKE
jgi:hypothetical protein